MPLAILTVNLRFEPDAVAARQRAKHIAKLLGFDAQDQTRIATSVSEIARNAFRYAGGGKVEYFVQNEGSRQILSIRVSDQGPGIADLNRILQGRYVSTTGMGMGILGAQRLMDDFQIESAPGAGTTVVLRKTIPRKAALVTPESLSRIANELALEKPQSAFEQLQMQNQELMRTLDELRRRQDELARVNRELEDTNRGVVALYAELDEKADHLRRADELKSKFLSNMSHEFRSPLNSILALTQLLLGGADGELNTDQKQQVRYARKAAEDLYELVNDLLDLAKVEAGKVEVKPAHFRISNLFGALRGMLRPLLLNQSVDLVFEESGGLPEMYSDEGKVSQILRNFISNALKFTERGEVRVRARLVGENQVEFSVADTGIGIAAQDQERIFQDFAQIENPIQKRVKGTGLGLPLSRKLAQLLAGDVRVESESGRGSTFYATLPLACGAERVQAAVVSEFPAGTVPILVVENSPETVLLYEKWLRDSEFRVIPVISVEDARRKLTAITPAAIVLDILLDGEDTWELLADLNRSPATADLPVVVVSIVEEQRKAYNFGASTYLTKPVDPAVLRNELRRLTGRKPAEQVLIIDDNESDRYLLKRWLRNTGMVITEAATANDGLRKARQERPSLIFLDLAMPEMSGYEVLDQLKADPATSSISIIVNTSMRLTEQDLRRLGDRPAAVLSKEGLDADTAVAALSKALRS